MLNNTVVKSRTVLCVCFTALLTVSGLASCGGGGGDEETSLRTYTTIYAFATPAILVSGTASIITWSSTNTTSCSSSPAGMIGSDTSGSFTTPPLTSTTTYTITCNAKKGLPAVRTITIVVAPASVVTPIVNTSTTCATEPMRGTVYYYCDCGSGAQANCVAGDDNNAGTSADAPRRTIASAVTRMRSTGGTNTMALCKGGAFDVQSALWPARTDCAAGTTCNDSSFISFPINCQSRFECGRSAI